MLFFPWPSRMAFTYPGAILRGEKALHPEMMLQPKMSASIFSPMGVDFNANQSFPSPSQLADVGLGLRLDGRSVHRANIAALRFGRALTSTVC
jgi:hypothetical protein